ncbi:MAG: hypothetical protein JNK82_19690 [Myxococcaceae bacterium]|nr:hypothetical protein [Myxococcaceae bacterium]
MKRALLLFTLSFAAAACRCYVPVIEGLDSGTAGGSAAGTAGGGATAGGTGTAGGSGSAGACGSAAQCTQPGPAMSLCSFGQTDAGYSCIDSECVFECTRGRTCSTAEDAGCLACGAARSCATSPNCNRNAVAALDSDNGCPMSFPSGLTLTPLANACGWTVTETGTTRTVGTVYQLDDGDFVAHIAELGGTCVGFALASQVERWLLSCPACQLELRL